MVYAKENGNNLEMITSKSHWRPSYVFARYSRGEEGYEDEGTRKVKVTEERRAAAEDRKVVMEEEKRAMEENLQAMENKKRLTSGMDEKEKSYVKICCDQSLARMMGAGFSGMGGSVRGGLAGNMGDSMGNASNNTHVFNDNEEQEAYANDGNVASRAAMIC
jgi:hypothetical protein